MKRILRIVLLSQLGLFISSPGWTSVYHSYHDMYYQGKGTDPNICSYCHIPHNAAGELIWSTWANEARLTTGPYTRIGNMCYTCHDGTVTPVGQDTAFNTSLQQHVIPSGEDCNACHSVHDNAYGKFMKIAKEENSYCAACHNSAVNAGGLGDYTGAGNHESYWPSGHPETHNTSCSGCHNSHGPIVLPSNSCTLCHTAHGAVNYSIPNISRPILRANNTDSAFCASCHNSFVQSTASGLMHPANLGSAGSWGKIACQSCHDPHQPGVSNHPMLLSGQNIDSNYCTTCHQDTDISSGPAIGHSHPTNTLFVNPPTDPVLTPAGNTIDDDEVNGIDYPSNSGNMICETCHSVHRKGVALPLLRISDDSGQLCVNCHADK